MTPGKKSRDRWSRCSWQISCMPRKVGDSICDTHTFVTNRNRRLLCACSIWSIAFDRKKGDVSVWRRVEVVNANNFHWSPLHMNEEPDLACDHFGVLVILAISSFWWGEMRWGEMGSNISGLRADLRSDRGFPCLGIERGSCDLQYESLSWIEGPSINIICTIYNRENHIQKSENSEDLAALRCGHWCATVVKCFGLFLRNAHYHNDIESGTSGNRSRRGKHYKRYFFSQLHGWSCWKDIYGRVLLKGSILGKTYLWCSTNCGFK